jgi:predicted alpha/beta hydrolase family esterase
MQRKLEKLWYQVFVPKFPTSHNQSLETWSEVFENYKQYIDSETIFIAHSVWPAFVLSVLENINTQIKGCYFAAGFLELLQLPEFDILNETITARQFNWEKIHENCKNFYMCHGDDDPYVPLLSAEIMADNLDVEIDIIDWGGHLNEETGYTSFEYLLDEIIWKKSQK